MTGQTPSSSPVKKTAEKLFAGKAGPGRPKGIPNKNTAALKDMILTALNEADDKGAVEYLKKQAIANPTAFLTLVGKILPLQVAGDPNQPITHRIELVGVMPK